MPEEEKRFEFVQLHSGGSLPGLPGDHAPGSYVIDWQSRTLTPALSLEAFLEARQSEQEQQSQNERVASETAEQVPVENVTVDTSPQPPLNPILSLG